jgi:hypothetical protein
MPDTTDPMARLAQVIERSPLSAAAADQAVVRRYGSSTRIPTNPFLATRQQAAVAATATAAEAVRAPAPIPTLAPSAFAPAAAPHAAQVTRRNPFSAFGKQSAAPVAPAPIAQAAQAAVAPAPTRRSAFGTFKASAESMGARDDEPVAEAPVAASAASAKPAPARAPGGGLVRVAAPERKKVNYTDEQLALQHSNAPLIVADAFAGCGKTTAAVGYTEAHSDWRILYICLGNANAQEARQRFPKNVTCQTTHAMARQAIKPKNERVTDRWKPMLVQDLLNISPREAMFAMKVLSQFFNSGDTSISMDHVDIVNETHDMTAQDRMSALSYAKLAWTRMNRDDDKMLMPHDAYLKMFAMRAPKLPYDAVVFDEAQDANPVTMQILQGQKSLKQMLCIGDRHQSIFQFRGAVNAMEELGKNAERHFLTQTWRFGPKVAEIANLLLGELKGEERRIQGLGRDGAWDETNVTHLTRTNAQLFRLAAERMGEGVHWIGGVEKYRVSQVLDAYHLYNRDRDLVSDLLMRRKFQHWDEYVSYAEDAGDAEARILVKIIDDFKHDTPELVEAIKANAVADAKDASLCLSTAHRAKGFERPNVRIGEDFELLEKAEAALADNAPHEVPEQDINLLYVAVTRAMNALQLNPETKTWLEKLDEHRQNRAAARTRHAAQLDEMRQAMRA